MNRNTLGTLYIVATPIGNMQDITFRAIEVLKTVDCIVAEDTRHSHALLQNYGIQTPTSALHEHNEKDRAEALLKKLEAGESIALISDAGTPLISDPGYHLVKIVREFGARVVPIPGACAAIAALSAAGLPTDRFIFEGFLPAKSAARKHRFEQVKQESRTLVFYEAPHRIQEFLQDALDVFGNARTAVIARELTKLFETITSGTLDELAQFVQQDKNQQKGEMVVLIDGLREVSADLHNECDRLLGILLESLSLKQSVELVTKITGLKKNTVYNAALKLKPNE